MPSIVVDVSDYFARTNQYPPKHGDYSFQIGSEVFEAYYAPLTLAVESAKAKARAVGVFTVKLLTASLPYAAD